jgi:hypothetical protein
MTDIVAGFWPCKVLNAFYGDDDRNIPVVRINVEITEGAAAGSRHTYEDQVNNKQGPYIERTCSAVGWAGESLSTLSADVEAWIKRTGGISTLEIKHIEVTRGKRAGTIWVKANSIGRGPKPLRASSSENLADADSIMRAARAERAQNGGAPPVDDAPPATDDDIPFASCSAVGLGEIARVLRW